MKVISKNQPYALRGFTLIELMVVIIVIGVVGGIVFSGAGYLFEKQSIKSAQTEIEVLKAALDQYKRENGAYPETLDCKGKDSSRILLHSLYGTHDLIDDDWAARMRAEAIEADARYAREEDAQSRLAAVRG